MININKGDSLIFCHIYYEYLIVSTAVMISLHGGCMWSRTDVREHYVPWYNLM